ncbi:hypothetical protein C2E23DRAFT_229088 [Lenzites betulinus]|nr:hypothetical protein C2E23DRAFT_229088 [Lenzites betulinus]
MSNFSQHQPPSPSIDPDPSSSQMSFDSPQIPGSIGPDRGMSRRRLRPPSRVQSHGELPEYANMTEAHDPAQNSHYPAQQDSRPQTPSGTGAPEFIQPPDTARLPRPTCRLVRSDAQKRPPKTGRRRTTTPWAPTMAMIRLHQRPGTSRSCTRPPPSTSSLPGRGQMSRHMPAIHLLLSCTRPGNSCLTPCSVNLQKNLSSPSSSLSCPTPSR